ncbi:MAG TPA: site-specific integrase [Vicinamibacterales bacterium]|jgi:integrase
MLAVIRSRRSPDQVPLDPAGKEYKPNQYPFGELGGYVSNIDRVFSTPVLKAHGYQPAWSSPGKLTQEARATLKTINLKFHDLRHEGASRLLENGWPLHHVQHMLGHASAEQTSAYLNVTSHGLEDSMRRFDRSALQSVAINAENRCQPTRA